MADSSSPPVAKGTSHVLKSRDDPEILLRRQKMFDVLDANAKEREAKKEERKQQKVSSGQQMVKDFLDEAAKFQTDITADMEKLSSSASDGTVSRDDVRTQLDAFVERTQAFQEKVANSSFFLPPYELRQADESMKTVKSAVEELRAKLLPKKKFSFRKKKKKKKKDSKPPKPVDAPADAKDDKKGVDDLLQTLLPEVITIRDRENETISLKPDGQDVNVTNVTGCTIHLLDTLGALRVDHAKDCEIIVGAVAGSVFVDHLSNCTLVLASRQIRIHHAEKSIFYLHVLSNPIIEHSTGCLFAPSTLRYPGLEEHLKKAQLFYVPPPSAASADAAAASASPATADSAPVQQRYENRWADVEDFNWLRQQQSPNWSVLPEKERKEFVINPGPQAQ